MASPFSWSDTVQIAFGSCLPCLKNTPSSEEEPENHNPTMNRIPRARPDELQGLLADPDTDVEAERLSLHSNPGRQRNKKKKKRRAKQNDGGTRGGITLFGYDLFGHAAPPPPIQLPDDDDDALYPDSGASRRRGIATPKSVTTAHSTASTFDSDAAPLDSEAIAAMSSPSAIEAAAQAAAEAEAQRLKEKEERRKRRREKKELKRVAEALARQGVVDGEGEEFEGFQGSGPTNSGYPRIRNMFPGPTSDSGSGSAFSSSTRDDFGHFVSAPPPPPGPYVPPTQDDEDEAADLDGGMYARRPPRGGPAGERSGEGSESRSRTSASMSDRAHQFPDPRNVVAHLQAHARLNSPSRPQSKSEPGEQQQQKRPKKSKSTSSRTTRSHSSTTTSQSPSLASPSLPAFPAEVQEVVSPSTVEQGQGFFDLEDEHLPVRNNASVPQANVAKTNTGFPTTRIGGGGFPMTGFGGGGARKTRDFGAFLARRGDDEGVDGLQHSSR